MLVCWNSFPRKETAQYLEMVVYPHNAVCMLFIFSDCFNPIYLSQFLHNNLLNIFYTDVVVKMEPVEEEITINQG